MRKNTLAAVLLLAFTCITAGYGQVRREPSATSNKRLRLSPYGVLLSMPGPNGVGVTQLEHEGYLLALRVKNSRTEREEEVVLYAVGAQQASANLRLVRQNKTETESVVQTPDKSIEITTTVKEKDGAVEVLRRIANTGYVSAKVVQAIIEVERFRFTDTRAAPCPIRGGLVYGLTNCNDCQGCGCAPPNCTMGPKYAQGTSRSCAFEDALPNRALPQQSTRQDVAALDWSEGVNFKSITLSPGRSIQLREILSFSQGAETRHR